MDSKKSGWRENLWLGLLVVVGVLLIWLQRLLEHDLGHVLASTIGGLGEALLIAGLLAFIVDRGIKTTLARDALNYMVGWEVPDSLREAIREIVRLPLVRRGFVVTYTIEHAPVAGFVRLTSETQFAVHNLTPRTQRYQFRSRVERLQFAAMLGQGANATLEMRVGPSATAWDSAALPAATDSGDSIERIRAVDIPANGARWFRTKREQYYPDNFFAVLDLLPPALEGIKVVVKQPQPAFIAAVHFGAEGEVSVNAAGDEWTHPAVHLPGQHVRLTWAPKPAAPVQAP